MFYNGLYFINENFRINLVPINFSSDFCFKYFDFSAKFSAHFDVCLITLFVIIICFLNQYYQYVFCNLNSKLSSLYNDSNVFETLSDTNSNFNNLFEILFIKDSLHYLLMRFINLTNLSISTYLSKSFSSGLIPINLQSTSFHIAFCLSISLNLFLSFCPFSSISIANLCLRK